MTCSSQSNSVRRSTNRVDRCPPLSVLLPTMRFLPLCALVTTAGVGILFGCRPAPVPPPAQGKPDPSSLPALADSAAPSADGAVRTAPSAEPAPGTASAVAEPSSQRPAVKVSANISASECAAAQRRADGSFASALQQVSRSCRTDADCALARGSCGVCGGAVGISKTDLPRFESATGNAQDACSVYWSGPSRACVAASHRHVRAVGAAVQRWPMYRRLPSTVAWRFDVLFHRRSLERQFGAVAPDRMTHVHRFAGTVGWS
jgi:hypothetical protein